MRERKEHALVRLSRWVFSECKLERKYVRTGMYIFKIYDAHINEEVRRGATGEALELDEAIHLAIDRLEEIKKSYETADDSDL